MTSVADVQRALIARGYDLGRSGPAMDGADGVWGVLSRKAAQAVQIAEHLPASGLYDAATLRALGLVPAAAPAAAPPPWFAWLGAQMGVRETPGPGNNPIILGWAKRLSAFVARVYTADSIPWCGLAIGIAVKETLPNEPIPSNPLWAANWARAGIDITDRRAHPPLGAIMVFTRNGGGHVSTYAGRQSATHYLIRGGNQSDQVNEIWEPKAKLSAIRWPKTYPLPVLVT